MYTRLRQTVKKYLTFRRVLFLLLFLIASFLWFKYIAGIIIVLVFIPITFLTVRYSKMIPHVSAESNTAMTFFIGYTFGPTYAFIYGPIVGVSCYVLNSFVSPGYMLTPVIAGITGALVGIMHFSFGMSFIQSFFIALVIRTLVAFPIFMMFYDPFEVTTHQVSQFLSNIILYLPLLSLLYQVVAPFV